MCDVDHPVDPAGSATGERIARNWSEGGSGLGIVRWNDQETTSHATASFFILIPF